MKTMIYVFSGVAWILLGCQTRDGSLERRAASEHLYRHSEPYSKEQRETIDDPAGANSQSREGQENPFIEPKAGETQQIQPLVQPSPPEKP